jgi:hypothetical protein
MHQAVDRLQAEQPDEWSAIRHVFRPGLRAVDVAVDREALRRAGNLLADWVDDILEGVTR